MGIDRDLEWKSSAVTLSDMEVFIFPELMYSLVLANLMSPRIWRWRDDPWFKGFDKKTPYRRITRLKQFIMDHYVFNLDLDTWGLTTKQRELNRFKGFVDADTLARSNALFGYEGDKYYFDIDIRTHFGLDKYEGDVIPYWKTETVEAMDAFRFRDNYTTGAGECVSLAALYAAALFVVARIPLEDIFLMATPLHSQNFVDIDDGILCNNRRLVTKNMWCNGTALSAQARRALENERVTIVTHVSGFVHTIYPEGTIHPDAYERFRRRLRSFLRTQLTDEILGSFLRHNGTIQKCFQIRWPIHGVDHYIGAERVLEYERGTSYRLTDNTRPKLMDQIEYEEFEPAPLPSRIVLDDLESFLKENDIDINDAQDVGRLKEQFASDCLNATIAIESLIGFCQVDPKLPEGKTLSDGQEPLGITPELTREELIERLQSIRAGNRTADLAFYTYRDLSRTEAEPFLAAAIQRNPVSVEAAARVEDIAATLTALPNESIYDGACRLAQPDEVWNFQRGDGVERAILLANVVRATQPDADLSLEITADMAFLRTSDRVYGFPSSKGLTPQVWRIPTRE